MVANNTTMTASFKRANAKSPGETEMRVPPEQRLTVESPCGSNRTIRIPWDSSLEDDVAVPPRRLPQKNQTRL